MTIKFKIFLKFILSIFLLALLACEHTLGVAPQQGGLQPTLSSIQDNIFTPKCVNQGCHPGSGAPMSLAQGVSFSTLVNVESSGFAPLLRVRPNDADNSVLLLKVIGDSRTGQRMPRNGPPFLDQEEIDTIRNWIENGALDN